MQGVSFPVMPWTSIAGKIHGYKSTRQAASFVFSDRDKTSLGVVAIAAGVAGLGGQTVSAASHAASAEEDADFVEFTLDDISAGAGCGAALSARATKWRSWATCRARS